eukprot:TRINITY_DN102698_c0_g1_i1.p1 TRINITY_DN102698_c0_g1~~TRINITY_DN102698_c0_g1_i1.p1  ORF type:complete len:649 (-),score=159.09 TRINITY_DN102698_c0_g1_i1:83-1972(-)
MTGSGTGLLRSRSVPGLQGVGQSKQIQLFGHGKKVTLGFTISGAVDRLITKAPPNVSDKACKMTEMVAEPSWRWAPHMNRAEEIKPEKPVDNVPKNMKFPRVQPAWMKHAGHVLRFYAFFQEHVVERWDENCRYRNVVMQYFLEDGTMNIMEPKIENSGLMQGQFLKRMQVPRPDGMGFIGPGDFVVGEDIDLYGVRYHITGADRFTRWFFEENGWHMGEDESFQKDTWQKTYTMGKMAERGELPLSRSAVEAKALTKYVSGSPVVDHKFIQFLHNDRKVLRFKAYWDDPTLYGNRIYFTVHYYLSDNTAEINEAHARNSGRDAYPVFFKRGPMYKSNKINCCPAMLAPEPDPYLPKDLMVGGSVNVWRRKFVIYDCDDFTQNFYKEFLGYDQKANCIDVSEIPKKHVKLQPPPHNGIGTDEDSLENCARIQPKAAKQDLHRLMTQTGIILRFECRMVNGEPEDENRRFIVGFFPADDNVACWELPVRNSGHLGGKFAEKKRAKNPDTGKYFKMSDLAIGQTVTIAAQPMLILRADEFTLKYLEDHADQFPLADPLYCAHRLVPILGTPEMQDPNGVDPDTLKAICQEHGFYILDHEIVTLLRHFCASEGGAPVISGPAVLSCLQQAAQ